MIWGKCMKIDNRIDFYNLIIDEVNEEDSNQVVDIIRKNGLESNFYELCHSIVMIMVNSDKIIDLESKELASKWNDSDVAVARLMLHNFIEKNRIFDISALMKMLKVRYQKGFNGERWVSIPLSSEDSRIKLLSVFDITSTNRWDELANQLLG